MTNNSLFCEFQSTRDKVGVVTQRFSNNHFDKAVNSFTLDGILPKDTVSATTLLNY
ncbi:hypothetical protein DSUL_50117 [Desulfovibrionales bacterium]